MMSSYRVYSRSLARGIFFALAFFLSVGAFSIFSAASAVAQTTPATPAQPLPTGSQGCGSWIFNANCNAFGNPANLPGNIAEARTAVKSIGCWSCNIFDAFSRSLFTYGQTASVEGDRVLRPLIVTIASLFALVYMGSAFVSGDASDLLGRWKVFWKLCIAVTIGTAWLSSGSFNNTWNYIYSPLLLIPLAVEQAVPNSEGMSDDSCLNTTGAPAAIPGVGATLVMKEMRGIVCGANNISLDGIAIGLGLSNTGDGLSGLIINAIAGIALVLVFAWLTITFPLKFIDVLLRLMVVGIIAPVLVVCAVFKPTRSYCQIAVKNVLYAGCLFAFTGIMFKLGYAFLHQTMTDATATTTGPTSVTGATVGALLVRAVTLVGSGIIFTSMVKMAPSLASEFSTFSGSSGGVGDAATSYASTIVALPAKGAGLAVGAAGAKLAVGKAATGLQQSVAAGAEKGTRAALDKSVTSE